MNEMDVTRVLAQIRALGAQAAQRPASAGPAAVAGAGSSPAPRFSEALAGAVKHVNNTQAQADQLRQAFQRGESGVDLARVMLAGSRAQVEFRAMVEVRNRMISAYQDIMNMPV